MIYTIAKWCMQDFLTMKILCRKKGKITEKEAVQKFIKEFNILDLYSFSKGFNDWFYEPTGSRYKWDQLWGIIDVQQEQQYTIERGYGDCDDHSRLVQMIITELGYRQYQVQYLQKPINYSHGSCVFELSPNVWTYQDYGQIDLSKTFNTPLEQASFVSSMYNSKIIKQFYIDYDWNKTDKMPQGSVI